MTTSTPNVSHTTLAQLLAALIAFVVKRGEVYHIVSHTVVTLTSAPSLVSAFVHVPVMEQGGQ